MTDLSHTLDLPVVANLDFSYATHGSTMIKASDIPDVSVIIPTFNRARMVEEAVDSVLSQKDATFELIVVDDGSSDNTADILNQYQKDIRMIRQPHRGVSAARNSGVRMAKGEHIAFLDSDDLWLPGKLSAQTAFFSCHPDALICQTEEIWIRNGVRVNPKKKHKKPSGMIFEPSLHLCLVSPSAVMLKRALFDEMGGFDEEFRICEDYDLWLRISCRYPIYLIDTPLIVKRGGHPDQLSKGIGLDRFRVRSIQKLLDGNMLNDQQEKAAISVLKDKCEIYALGCRKRGRLEEAFYYENLANRYDEH